jgi:hypothetical protein
VISNPTQQAPLFTAAGNGGQESAMSADSNRMMMWTNYEYVAGEGLSTQGGSGTVYQLQRVGTPEGVLADVADAFGVSGAPAKSTYYDEAYPTYVVGPEDGTAPSVVVSWVGTGDWWYNDPAAYPAISCDADGVCQEAPVTENLAPSESEARTIAQQLFADTGFEVDAADIRVYADEWQTTASASLVVDGTKTAIEWSVGWGTTGLISYAYGHSLDVVEKGNFGTVSAHDAVDRLADWRWFGSAGPDYQGGVMTFANDALRSDAPDTSVESPTTDETSAPTEEVPPAEPTEPAVDPTVEPEPEPTLIDPLPVEPTEPETVTVTVDEAFETLLLVWDADGNAWLVPGFAMPHPDGWFNSVISLIEGVITLPEPMAIEPMLLDDTVQR